MDSGCRTSGTIKVKCTHPPQPQRFRNTQNHTSTNSCTGLRGLRNLGSTCFMNAILQTFIHNPLLRDYFLGDNHNRGMCRNDRSRCLACQIDQLFTTVILTSCGIVFNICSFIVVIERLMFHISFFGPCGCRAVNL